MIKIALSITLMSHHDSKTSVARRIFGSNGLLFVELEERRSDHHITITVVSVDFVLMYNTGILVETLEECSSHRKSLAELCSFSQLSFVQNNNYSEHVFCQCASEIRTLYDCFSFVKSFRKKKNPTILIKQSKSTSHGEQQQSPQHLMKMKCRF